MSNMTGLEFKLQEMAGRIKTLREIVELTPGADGGKNRCFR